MRYIDMTQEQLKKEIEDLTSMKEVCFKSDWDIKKIAEAKRQIERQEEIINQEKTNYENIIKRNKGYIKEEKKKIKQSEKHIKQNKEIKEGFEFRIKMIKQIKDNKEGSKWKNKQTHKKKKN